MFCIHCGKELQSGSAFCTSCGAAQNDPEPIAQQETQADPFRPAGDVAPQEGTAVAEEVPAVVEDDIPASAEESVPIPAPAPASEEATFYTEPAFTPAAEEPVYAEPAEPAKPAGKPFPFLIIAAAVAALVILIGSIVWIAAASSPEAKLLKAARKSGAELEDVLGNSDTFVELLENAAALTEKEELTAKVDYEMDYSYSWMSYSQTFSVLASRSAKGKEMYVDFKMRSDYSFYDEPSSSTELEVLAYADSKQLVAAMPNVLDDAYYLPLHKLGSKFSDSDLYDLLEDEIDKDTADALECLNVNLFADTSWSAFKKAYPDEAKEFTKSLVIEKTDDRIPHADDSMKVYSIQCDMSALVDMIVAYELFAVDAVYGEGVTDALDYMEDELRYEIEELEDYDIVLYAGVKKGCLTALHIELDDGYYENSATLLLEGRENIWEDCTVYLDGEKACSGGFEKTSDGFEFTLREGREKLLQIECDDDAGQLSFEVDGEKFCVEYSAENRGCQLSFALNDEYSLYVELLPLEKIPKIQDPINLLGLDKGDLEDLLDELEESLDSLF